MSSPVPRSEKRSTRPLSRSTRRYQVWLYSYACYLTLTNHPIRLPQGLNVGDLSTLDVYQQKLRPHSLAMVILSRMSASLRLCISAHRASHYTITILPFSRVLRLSMSIARRFERNLLPFFPEAEHQKKHRCGACTPFRLGSSSTQRGIGGIRCAGRISHTAWACPFSFFKF